MTKLQEVANLGQSIWLDNIHRTLIVSGELRSLVDEGLRGVTSNPTIFEKAISGGTAYDGEVERLAGEGKSAKEIYEALAMEDIAMAADILRPVYDATQGEDGFVSLEVNPDLAQDTEGTVAEARRLFSALDRPNVMIKVPATEAGLPAVERLTADGINVNVTLIFSLRQYEKVVEAYIRGLERRAEEGKDLRGIASVASLFVSRVDTMVDPLLEKAGARDLLGKVALANAKVIYARFRRIFSTKRWKRLAGLGAKMQRLLWGSTSTKNPRYPDTLYVDELIGPYTVNTVPPETLQAFRDHGKVARTVGRGLTDARANLKRLSALGIDLEQVCRKLQEDGVAAFKKSFDDLLSRIGEKKEKSWSRFEEKMQAAFEEARRERIVPRLWARDHTLWKPYPEGISNRLGWLESAKRMAERVGELNAFAGEIWNEGYRHCLLLGMGGASLAPFLFRKAFGVGERCPDLSVLDSTVPAEILGTAERLDPGRTLYIVSSKSGTTVETTSLFKYFFARETAALGIPGAGRNFVAITDPGSPLDGDAKRWDFRRVFHGEPDVGGRYSALSRFGLVPAALIGLDLEKLLDRAITTMRKCGSEADNEALRLGLWMGEAALVGRDKLTFLLPPALAAFGDWVEQLIAESTGKEGKGILPVVGEQPGPPEAYGGDRLFVSLSLAGDEAGSAALEGLEAAGHPVLRLHLSDLYDIGGQFFLWETATAVAGWRLKVNPFDQPDVEASKELTRRFIAEYREKGGLPDEKPVAEGGGLAVFGQVTAPDPVEALRKFLGGARPGDYIAIQAYIRQTQETDGLFSSLRKALRDRYRTATTVGYGPRYLHSTGQLHKGDGGRGLFLQITASDGRDVGIPEDDLSPGVITFGVLKAAQALADRRALEAAGRRVLRCDFGSDISAGLRRLLSAVT